MGLKNKNLLQINKNKRMKKFFTDFCSTIRINQSIRSYLFDSCFVKTSTLNLLVQVLVKKNRASSFQICFSSTPNRFDTDAMRCESKLNSNIMFVDCSYENKIVSW
ncbi:mutant GABA gated chloride channel [Sarcoptes scabiei]|nr:mutant GABA gated chloride channel [Sarcoptes scabiei]